VRIRTIVRILRTGLLPAALLALGLAAARPATAQSSGGAWLGVYTQSLSDELRDEFNHRGDGVLVARVVSDGPADRAGLRRGDIIVSVGGRNVTSPASLSNRVRAYRPGQYVAVKVMRDGRERTFNVRLGSRDDVRDDDQSEDFEWTPAPAPEAPEPPDAPAAPKGSRRIVIRDHADGRDVPGLERLRELDLEALDDLPLTMLGRGRLGVRVETLSPGLADYFAGATKGALVLEVTAGSAAEKAGIRAGDVITRVGDTDVADADDLVSAVRRAEGATQVTLVRRGQTRTVEAVLERSRMPRVQRFRGGPGPGRTFEWRSDGFDRDELRRELDELRRELRELRREIEDRR